MPAPLKDGRVVGVLDLGSNSARLLLARVHPDAAFTVLNQVKHMIRLGEGAFTHRRLRDDAMDRALGVLQGMADMCAVYGARDVTAIATAAVRDTDNGADFLRRVREKTGLDFTVVSGREEARLIWLGVSSCLEPTDKLRLVIDIGGGSTELIVADSRQCRNLESLRMGCVRLTDLFFRGDDGPVSAARYAEVQRYIRRNALHAFRRIGEFDIGEAVASSGTAQNLAEIAASLEQAGPEQDAAARAGLKVKLSRQLLSYEDLRRAATLLRSLPLEERRKVPGINPDRADVIVAGAALLQTIMEEQGFESVRVSGRSLLYGILIDYMLRRGLRPGGQPSSPSPHARAREESVLQLARFCRFEEEHARHVAALALELFDSSAVLGLHRGDPRLRGLLHDAALLHDIGIFLSFTAHNMHGHYLIRNTELLGFTDREIEIMAAAVFFHRKRPSRRYTEYRRLDKDAREAVRLLSLFLTLAERMDKSHAGLVRRARFTRNGGNAGPEPGGETAAPGAGLELRLTLAGNCCAMELEEVERTRKFIRREFGEDAVVVTETSA